MKKMCPGATKAKKTKRERENKTKQKDSTINASAKMCVRRLVQKVK